MYSANLPREITRIKFRARWIELSHWRRIGMRLLWRSVLMNLKLWSRKMKLRLARRAIG